MKFRSFGDSTSSSIREKLQTIRLCRLSRRVTIVNFRMNERSSNGASSSLISSITNTS